MAYLRGKEVTAGSVSSCTEEEVTLLGKELFYVRIEKFARAKLRYSSHEGEYIVTSNNPSL